MLGIYCVCQYELCEFDRTTVEDITLLCLSCILEEELHLGMKNSCPH